MAPSRGHAGRSDQQVAKRRPACAMRPAQSQPKHRHAAESPICRPAARPKASARTSRPRRGAWPLCSAAQQANQQATQQRRRASRQTAPARRSAALAAAQQANIAHRQPGHCPRRPAAGAARLASANVWPPTARIGQSPGAHNARVAAQRAHWIALHGDGSGGQQHQVLADGGGRRPRQSASP